MKEQCTYYHIRRQTCLENTVLNSDWLVLIRYLAQDWLVKMLLASDWSPQSNPIGQIWDRAQCALFEMFRNVALQTGAIPGRFALSWQKCDKIFIFRGNCLKIGSCGPWHNSPSLWKFGENWLQNAKNIANFPNALQIILFLCIGEFLCSLEYCEN